MRQTIMKHFFVYTVMCTTLLSFCHAVTFEEVTWLVNPSNDDQFTLVPQKYTTTKQPIFIKKTVYTAFLDLHQAAHMSGINLFINSGRRSFADQKILFTQYWFDRALPPGTSSHHFWQAIDIAFTYSWGNADKRLKQHAGYYWFCQTYDGHSSGQWAESRHYEYNPEEFRQSLIWFRDEIYLYLKLERILEKTSMSKKELFDTYVYPISHACIDAYPSRLKDVVTWIRFDRKLDSGQPEQLIYTLSRYKFPAWTWLLNLLPPEIRFIKTKTDWLRFAALTTYPRQVQDLFFDYEKRFREGVERFVLLRTYQQLARINQPKVTFLQKK